MTDPATTTHWLELAKDTNTGIETLRAHFTGHAYDPHWHAAYLIGVTEQGVQQFNCRKKVVNSHQGQVFMLEPDELHDGNAPEKEGFTYSMLYVDPVWLKRRLAGLYDVLPGRFELGVEATLKSDGRLAGLITQAFQHLHYGESNIVKDTSLDNLLSALVGTYWTTRAERGSVSVPAIAKTVRDLLHANVFHDIGLETLSEYVGVDRFRLTRAFKTAYHQAPYHYLLRLRLAKARELLARGVTPAHVAAELCFADQSHLGRWFKRCYGLTPAAYRKICTNLPD